MVTTSELFALIGTQFNLKSLNFQAFLFDFY